MTTTNEFHCNKCGEPLGVFDQKRVLDHWEWHKLKARNWNLSKPKHGKTKTHKH